MHLPVTPAPTLAREQAMKRLDLEKLGPREVAPGRLHFGLYLPWVSAAHGNRLFVKIIHAHDQFLHDIPPLEFELAHSRDADYGDYWSAEVDLAATPVPPGSRWGQPGSYVYRYCLESPLLPARLDWIIDPFAREYGVGALSAFTMGHQPHVWGPQENAWRTPELADLVVYELQLNEFGGDIAGARARLEYLADLGVNAVEVMPVSNTSSTIDWGYIPLGYFGVDERLGKRGDFQAFVEEAHRRGIAVIIDAVYAHTHERFPYAYVYDRLGYHENPFMEGPPKGNFAETGFGRGTDWRRQFTRDFYYTVNRHWLEVYHVDGLRYDYVPGFWDGAAGKGYAALVYETYQETQARLAAGDWPRFSGNPPRLIQCAEHLPDPAGILRETYSNLAWQNATLGAAAACTRGEAGAIERLGFATGLAGVPMEVTHNGSDTLAKTALQYIENHDHERFVCRFGTDFAHGELLGEGRRAQWFRVQPYLIATLLARGAPLLWQGGEVLENYWLPAGGYGRVALLRPVRWEYFYDEAGRGGIALVRRLLRLRRERAEFRRGEHYFYNHFDFYLARGLLLFSRRLGDAFSLVAINFTDQTQGAPFTFEHAGDYTEALHGEANLLGVTAGETRRIEVPSNYGRVWSVN